MRDAAIGPRRSWLGGLLVLLAHGLVGSPAAQTRPEIFVQLGHSSDVTQVAFSPNGRTLASGSLDKAIKLWDVATGRELRTLSGHADPVLSVAFASDGRTLASASEGQTIRLWDVATGREFRTLTGHKTAHGVHSHHQDGIVVAFAPDGRTLASGSVDETVKLWDVATGRELRTLIGHASEIVSLAFAPGGRALASGSSDKTIKLWDVATGRELRTLQTPTIGPYSVSSVAFAPDGRTLASGSYQTVRLWDVATGRELRTLTGLADWIHVLAFAPDGRGLAVGVGHVVTLWEVSTGRELRTFTGSYWSHGVTFSPDGRTLAAGVGDSATLWDMATGRVRRTLAGHSSWVRAVAFAPDGRILASGSADKTVKLWDLATGGELRTLTDHPGWVDSVAFAPDGRVLASGSGDRTVKLWDVATGRALHTLAPPVGNILVSSHRISLAFAPDGRTLAWGTPDKKLGLWDVATGRVLRALTHSSWVSSVAFAPDGRTLAAGSYQTITLWDPFTGRELRTLSGHSDWIHAVAFASDGRTLASGSDDNTVKLWDVGTGRESRTLTGHLHWVRSVAFAPDGRTLASGGWDNATRIWDVASGKERAAFVWFDDGQSIAITPEGYYDATSEEAEEYLNVRIGSQVFGIGAFRERFYRPDLVRLALAGASLASFARLDQVKAAPWVELLAVPGTTTQPEIPIKVRLTDDGGGIGDIRVFLNGSAVTQAAGRDIVPHATGATTVRGYTVRLVNGRNELRVVAFNRDNSAQGTPAVAEIMAQLQPTRPALHGVVVGIQEFRNPQFALKYPIADARRFADTLRRYAGPLFSRINLKVLTTPAETTRASLLQSLPDIRQAVGPEDLFVFFVASHGTVDDGEYYLLTSNVGSASTERLKADAVSQTMLKELLANIPATKKLVVIDTCNAATLGDQLQTAFLTRGLSDVTAMKILSRAVGSTVLSASTSTQQALEGYRGHGLLTWVIAEGLRGNADRNGDGFVSTLELATYVDEQVPVLAEQVFKRAQYPMVSPSGQGFPLAKVR